MKKILIALAIAAALTPQLAEAGAYTLARGAFAGLSDWKTLAAGDVGLGEGPRGRIVWSGASRNSENINPQPQASLAR